MLERNQGIGSKTVFKGFLLLGLGIFAVSAFELSVLWYKKYRAENPATQTVTKTKFVADPNQRTSSNAPQPRGTDVYIQEQQVVKDPAVWNAVENYERQHLFMLGLMAFGGLLAAVAIAFQRMSSKRHRTDKN